MSNSTGRNEKVLKEDSASCFLPVLLFPHADELTFELPAWSLEVVLSVPMEFAAAEVSQLLSDQ